jgi:hypothetical protein
MHSAAPERVDLSTITDKAFFARFPRRHYRLRRASQDEIAAFNRNATAPSNTPQHLYTITNRARIGATAMTFRATFATRTVATAEELRDEDFARSIFDRMIPDAARWFAATCRHPALVLTIEAGPN